MKMGAYLPLPYVYEREGRQDGLGIFTVDYCGTESFLLAPLSMIM